MCVKIIVSFITEKHTKASQCPDYGVFKYKPKEKGAK